MTPKFYAGIGAAAITMTIMAPAPVAGQSVKAPTAKLTTKAAKNWTPPRTADGHPDLQGYWTNATLIPLERPVELGNKEFYTDAEAAAMDKQRIQRENSQAKTDIHYDNVIWQHENYSKVASTRTSLIFDPPNGRVPPLSATGQKRAAAEKEAARRRELAESAQDRSLGERCLSWGNEGPPMLGSTYNANLQIVQTPASVAIGQEIIHGVRIVPMDGRPHLLPEVRQLGGDSRGHWEGDTLVVDTTNFTDQTNFRPPPATGRQDIFSSRDLHVVERFTRTDPDTIIYRFTVEDPSIWTNPWSGELLMRRIEGPIFEYACHEGNYGLANILAAARAKEKAAEETSK
jgi:hypothetical protein